MWFWQTILLTPLQLLYYRYQNVRTSILNMFIFNFLTTIFYVIQLSDWSEFCNTDSLDNQVQAKYPNNQDLNCKHVLKHYPVSKHFLNELSYNFV